jgi:hypothetical protein
MRGTAESMLVMNGFGALGVESDRLLYVAFIEFMKMRIFCSDISIQLQPPCGPVEAATDS